MLVLEVLFSGIAEGAIYAIVAIGIILVWSVTKVLNLTAGEFVMLGGMVTAAFYELGFSLPLAAILAVVISSIIAAAIWRIFIQPLLVKGASPLTVKLMTLVVALVISGGALLAWGTSPKELPPFVDISLSVKGAHIQAQAPWIWAGILVMIVGFSFLFYGTLMGKALRACAEQPMASKLMGIAPYRMGFFAFMIAAGLGAAGGVLLTPLTMAHYAMGLHLTIGGILAAFVGGVTSAPGAIIGGLILGIARNFAGAYISATFMEVFALGAFLIILLARPQGIMGTKELEI